MQVCNFHLKNRGVEIHYERSPAGLTIECRATHITQVLINLVNNAVDAVRRLENKWVRIEARDHGKEVLIRVIDSGDGIPQTLRAQIMTPFFTTKKEGTGLGLSLSKSILKDHGGNLEIDETVNYTCFQVRIPKQFARPTL